MAQFAVCPRIEEGVLTKSPKLFESESAAQQFLHSEVEWPEAPVDSAHLAWEGEGGALAPLGPIPNGLEPILNKSQGWQNPVPVVLADYSGPKCDRALTSDLREEDVAVAVPELSRYEEIERALWRAFSPLPEDRYRPGDFICYLDEGWRFDAIEADSWRREGHAFEGQSIAQMVVRAAYDLDASLRKFHRPLSCAAKANFWQSWQVQQHIADFCTRLVESVTARAPAGYRIAADAEARRARVFVYRKLAVFTHELLDEANPPVEAPTMNPNGATEAKPDETDAPAESVEAPTAPASQNNNESVPAWARGLRAVREGKNLSRAGLAQRLAKAGRVELRCTAEAIKKHEEGHVPNPDTRAAYATFYGKPMDDLFPPEITR
jgi:hypothetical protein